MTEQYNPTNAIVTSAHVLLAFFGLVHIIYGTLWLYYLSELFSEKKRAFYFGRKKCFQEIKKNDYGVFRSKETTVIWFHCSSLGEFEQSKPLIKKIKNFLPKNKIAVTFFSPSGFLTAKTNTLIDWIGYIPLDTTRKINLLIKFINPKVLILSKNDFWPNLLHLLKNKSIPVVSISSKFRKNDWLFRYR